MFIVVEALADPDILNAPLNVSTLVSSDVLTLSAAPLPVSLFTLDDVDNTLPKSNEPDKLVFKFKLLT